MIKVIFERVTRGMFFMLDPQRQPEEMRGVKQLDGNELRTIWMPK